MAPGRSLNHGGCIRKHNLGGAALLFSLQLCGGTLCGGGTIEVIQRHVCRSDGTGEPFKASGGLHLSSHDSDSITSRFRGGRGIIARHGDWRQIGVSTGGFGQSWPCRDVFARARVCRTPHLFFVIIFGFLFHTHGRKRSGDDIIPLYEGFGSITKLLVDMADARGARRGRGWERRRSILLSEGRSRRFLWRRWRRPRRGRGWDFLAPTFAPRAYYHNGIGGWVNMQCNQCIGVRLRDKWISSADPTRIREKSSGSFVLAR